MLTVIDIVGFWYYYVIYFFHFAIENLDEQFLVFYFLYIVPVLLLVEDFQIDHSDLKLLFDPSFIIFQFLVFKTNLQIIFLFLLFIKVVGNVIINSVVYFHEQFILDLLVPINQWTVILCRPEYEQKLLNTFMQQSRYQVEWKDIKKWWTFL